MCFFINIVFDVLTSDIWMIETNKNSNNAGNEQSHVCFCSKKVHGNKHFDQRLLHSSHLLESIFRTMSRLRTQEKKNFNGSQNEGGDDEA